MRSFLLSFALIGFKSVNSFFLTPGKAIVLRQHVSIPSQIWYERSSTASLASADSKVFSASADHQSTYDQKSRPKYGARLGSSSYCLPGVIQALPYLTVKSRLTSIWTPEDYTIMPIEKKEDFLIYTQRLFHISSFLLSFPSLSSVLHAPLQCLQ